MMRTAVSFASLTSAFIVAGLFLLRHGPTPDDPRIDEEARAERRYSPPAATADIGARRATPSPLVERKDSGRTLMVTVLDEHRSPLRNRVVVVTRLSGGIHTERLTRDELTNESGTATFESVSDGRHCVVAAEEGMSVAAAWIDLPVDPHQDHMTLIASRRGARVRGEVRHADGTPGSDLLLEFHPRQGRVTSGSIAGVAPNRRGRYESPPLARGSYLLRLLRGSNGQEIELREIDVQTSDRTLDFVLQATATLRGSVVDARGTPVAADVALTPQSSPELGGVMLERTSANGTFELDHAPAGRYRLTLRADGYEAMRRVVTLHAREVLDLRCELIPGGAIEGRLEAPGLDPRSVELRVLRYDTAGLTPVRGRWSARPDGTFVIGHLPFGRYRVKVSGTGFAWTASPAISLDADRPLHDLTMTLDVGGTLAGTALLSDGRPARGRLVLRIRHPSAGLRVLATEVDHDGRYEVLNVPSGTIDVEVRSGVARAGNPSLVIRDGEVTDWFAQLRS